MHTRRAVKTTQSTLEVPYCVVEAAERHEASDGFYATAELVTCRQKIVFLLWNFNISLIVLFVVIHAISTFLENLAFAIALHFLHLNVVQFTL